MQLKLMLRGPTRLLNTIPEVSLETGSLIIGRSPDADWTIPDPERILSKAHCRIERTERGFYIIDTSTNGVRINNVAVTRGLSTPIGNGDILTLGDALISVEITSAPSRRPERTIPDDPFIKRPFTPVLVDPVAPVPTADTRAAAPPPSPALADPFHAGMKGPFDMDEPASPVAGGARAESGENPGLQSPVTASGSVQADWWDPNAGSGKPQLPDYGAASSDCLVSEPVATPELQPASSENFPLAAALSQVAAKVDARTLALAVEKAVSVLSEDERKKFDERLGEILREEASRWS